MYVISCFGRNDVDLTIDLCQCEHFTEKRLVLNLCRFNTNIAVNNKRIRLHCCLF